MRKITLLFVALLVGLGSFAQEVINVAPDYTNGGALNAAIAANGSNKIYMLEADGYYTLTATIELIAINPGEGFVIEGAIPGDGEYMPVLQTGLNAENAPFDFMFDVKADISFKNVFIANNTSDGQTGGNVAQLNEKVRIEMDGCVVDPVGTTDMIRGNDFSDLSDVFLTNNKFLRQGNAFSPGGGHMLRDIMADTLYVENNSFISTDHTILMNTVADKTVNFTWFNHNTVIWHDVGLKGDYDSPNEYINNNLFQDLTNYVQLTAWNGDPDASFGAYPTVKLIDTATVAGVNESLPSLRKIMWNRNAQYVSDDVKNDMLGHGVNNPDEPLWVYPIEWNAETPKYFVTDWDTDNRGQNIIDDSRSTMFGSDDFPDLVIANTFYDQNPNWVDERVATHSTDVANSALWWFYNLNILTGEPSGEQPSQFWDVDAWAGTTAALYPTVWPRWDGEYTNEVLLTASTGGYPLGDLNAFPEQKAEWEPNKDAIMEHILSMETEQVALSVEEIKALDESFRMYPNPTQNRFRIESKNTLSNVKIYTMLGQLVQEKKLDGSSANIDIENLVEGIYFVEVNYAKGIKITSKIIKE